VRDFKRYLRAFNAYDFAAPGKQGVDLAWKPACTATEYCRYGFSLFIIGSIVDKDTKVSSNLPGPQVAIEAAHPNDSEVVQDNISIVPLFDVPEKNRLAEIVVRSTSERTRASYVTTTIVEPIAGNAPIRRVCHGDLQFCRR